MTAEPWRPEPLNLVTDVPGLLVGQCEDERLRSGVTAILFEEPARASMALLGGAPGTRDTELLAPANTVASVDALVLSGGSAFGLDSGAGVQSLLRKRNRGFEVAGIRVPIVPAAILFDLANGGDKDWGLHSPYRELGLSAAEAAAERFGLGSAGAGFGATTATVRGGLGSASARLANGWTVGALAAVNALGSPLVGSTRHFWASPFEIDGEFGGLGAPSPWPGDASLLRSKMNPAAAANTTIALVATDAPLGKAALKRLAVAAQTGLARAIWPSHTDFDGDLVFAASTARGERPLQPAESVEIAAAAAATMARAVARGVFEASSALSGMPPAWRDLPER